MAYDTDLTSRAEHFRELIAWLPGHTCAAYSAHISWTGAFPLMTPFGNGPSWNTVCQRSASAKGRPHTAHQSNATSFRRSLMDPHLHDQRCPVDQREEQPLHELVV